MKPGETTMKLKTIFHSAALVLAAAFAIIGPAHAEDPIGFVSRMQGSITTQNLVPTGTATAGSAVEWETNGAASFGIQPSGTYTGALSLQGTINGITWETVGGTPFIKRSDGSATATIASGLTGIYTVNTAGYWKLRVSGLAAMTGGATVTLYGIASDGTSTATVSGTVAATQSGTWTVQPGNTANTTAWKVDGSAVTQPVSGSATGSAVPAGAFFMGARSGANLVGVIQGSATAKIDVSTATTTEIVALSGSTKIYVTSLSLIAGGTGNIKFVYGTGVACATGTTDLTANYPLVAQSGLALGGGLGPVLVVPASQALCVTTSAGVQMSGHLTYTQF